MTEEEPKNENQDAVQVWETNWKNHYLERQKSKFQRVLSKYDVQMSENECDHYFDMIQILNQDDFTQKLRETEDCVEEEITKLAETEWGYFHGDKIYINPIKKDGRSIPPGTQTGYEIIFHEVIHASSAILGPDQSISRVGIFTFENMDFRQLGEIITNELSWEMEEEQPGASPPPYSHDMINGLKRIAPYKLWVQAVFSVKQYEELKKVCQQKLGDNALEIIALLCEYGMTYSFYEFVETGHFTPPKGLDKGKIENFRKYIPDL